MRNGVVLPRPASSDAHFGAEQVGFLCFFFYIIKHIRNAASSWPSHDEPNPGYSWPSPLPLLTSLSMFLLVDLLVSMETGAPPPQGREGPCYPCLKQSLQPPPPKKRKKKKKNQRLGIWECILPPPHSRAALSVELYVILTGSASCVCTFRLAFPPQCRAHRTYRERGGGGAAGSGRNGTLGRKRAGIPLGNVVGNFLSNLPSSLMVQLKYVNGLVLALR